MKRSDAIILILNASVPSFNESIRNFFETVDKDDDGIAIGEKLFVFGNRADMSNSLSENIIQIFSDIRKCICVCQPQSVPRADLKVYQ